ncbi:unnamed protein product [Blumeria hordei]|uniref:Alpha-1,3-glucosyltransferase n=1 Tax=Blumeria hordei TaxID=2867405 RepID=A0A383V242_BLUHO|nr:unnamed protein product [Blumeria hordei]
MAATAASPHRSRRKPRKSWPLDLDVRLAASPPRTRVRPAYPLAALLWPARNVASQWEVLPPILMVIGLLRWAASLWGYSGYAKPPHFGDYEAQRHWMEITTHLPISQWYFYDLEWWGLDYPLLTAYHSLVMGHIGSIINPEWFALDTSRGFDDPSLKIFMRSTVIISEFLVYIPATIIFLRHYTKLHGVHPWNANVALTAILLQPGLILIDHVHFQYNTVMLGLVLACMSSILARRLLWGCVFFVLALAFKQMALYYAPAIFAYLLGVCIFPRINFTRFLSIAIITSATFATLFLPFILGILYDVYRGIAPPSECLSTSIPQSFAKSSYLLDWHVWYNPIICQVAQLLHRIFPFARGLFEDKVANFWCALNVLVKLRHYPSKLLQQASLVATTLAILPPCLVIFARPRMIALPLALSTTAWGFFLFSFQVHEKSVLLPLMPMTVLLAGNHGFNKNLRAWVGFANLLAVWTMFPLLQRIEVRIPYYVFCLLWAYLLGLPPTSLNLYRRGRRPLTWLRLTTASVHGFFYVAIGLWHLLEAFVKPPADKPDLWVILNVCLGALGFGLCYLWCLGSLLVECGIFVGTSRVGKAEEKKE